MSKSDYIQIISDHSDEYGDMLLEFMDWYDIRGLYEATKEQLKEFCIEHGLMEVRKQ